MPSWKERGLVSHRHNCLGAFVMTHTGKLFVATPLKKMAVGASVLQCEIWYSIIKKHVQSFILDFSSEGK